MADFDIQPDRRDGEAGNETDSVTADDSSEEPSPYASPRSESVKKRNLITGVLLVLFVLIIITISVVTRM